MAHCMRLEDLTDYVRDKIVNEKWSHRQLSEYLQARYPGLRGFSVRNIERFCAAKGIHRTCRIPTLDLDKVVSEAVTMVRLELQPHT